LIKISVIIVNYRGWKPLLRCLESLDCLKDADFSSEVIVVDNLSNDGKLQEFSKRFPSCRFIENKGNFGFSNGNNLGAKNSRGEYLMFLNPDTVVNLPAIIKMLKEAEQNPDYHILSCQQHDEAENDKNPFGAFPSFKTITGINRAIYRLLRSRRVDYNCEGQSIIFPDWVSGSLIFINRKFFEQTGGWSDDFWLYSEDVDLCKRVNDLGGKIAFLCDTRIMHKHGGVTRQSIKLKSYTKAQVLISKHIYISKHYRGIKQAFLQAYLILTNLIELLIPAFLGLLLFFVPVVRVYFLIFFYLLNYYTRSVFRRSWLPGRQNLDFPVK
jgi:GT2 family glycosyltransferase